MEKELRDRFFCFMRDHQICEATYSENPTDADNLTRWGGALLQLSQFQAFPESKNMLLGAISRFEDALVVNPKKHDSLWCMGNAYTSLAFLVPDQHEAKVYFSNAAQYFQLALDEDPSNDLYRKSVQVVAKAPQLHSEFHNQGGFPQQTMASEDLTRWGGALHNLSLFPDFPESKNVLSRFALMAKLAIPKAYFGKTALNFPRAPDIDPSNYLYRKARQVAAKIHNEGGFPQQTMASGPSSSTSTKNPKKKNNDLKYVKLGWVILAVGIVASVGFWISHVPPPPPQ